jgi:hypothetical protein
MSQCSKALASLRQLSRKRMIEMIDNGKPLAVVIVPKVGSTILRWRKQSNALMSAKSGTPFTFGLSATRKQSRRPAIRTWAT